MRQDTPMAPNALRRAFLPRLAYLAAALACAASTLAAHDFWLIPDAFAVIPGGRLAVRGQTSSLFPSSLSAVTPERIVAAKILTATTSASVRNVSVLGTSLRLAHPAPNAGQHVVGVQLAPRSIRESPASFRRYLDLEGAPEARERYEREGLLPRVGGDSITRRYAKYAKTIIEVGHGAPAFQRALQHPLEFIPLTDPAALRPGDSLRVRLVLLGKPAAFAHIHAGSVSHGATALQDTAAARRAASRDVALITDGSGVATIALPSAGLWNVRTLQILPAVKGSGADWDVHWATMVFAVTKR